MSELVLLRVGKRRKQEEKQVGEKQGRKRTGDVGGGMPATGVRGGGGRRDAGEVTGSHRVPRAVSPSFKSSSHSAILCRESAGPGTLVRPGTRRKGCRKPIPLSAHPYGEDRHRRN